MPKFKVLDGGLPKAELAPLSKPEVDLVRLERAGCDGKACSWAAEASLEAISELGYAIIPAEWLETIAEDVENLEGANPVTARALAIQLEALPRLAPRAWELERALKAISERTLLRLRMRAAKDR